jgi:hypothetical protein
MMCDMVNTTEDLLLGFFEFLPFPAWIKYVDDHHTKMFRINKEYESQFGIRSEAYCLNSGVMTWGAADDERFSSNDERVLKHKRFIAFQENFLNPITNKYVECTVWKWPLFSKTGHPIAVFGIITEIKHDRQPLSS